MGGGSFCHCEAKHGHGLSPVTDNGHGQRSLTRKGTMEEKKQIDNVDDEIDSAGLLREARENRRKAVDAERENRIAALDDLRFVNGEQWPAELKNARDAEGRPCLTINRLPSFIDRVVGDQRQGRPSIKVRPADTGSDPVIAEILGGIIKNIENRSGAEAVYDSAFEQAVTMGFGYFRVTTDYADEGSFDQEILIKPVPNPFSVYLDPAAIRPDRSDAKWAFITEVMGRDEFKRRFPDARPLDAESGIGEEFEGWFEKDRVRIAEYWVKRPIRKTLCLMSDGSTLERVEALKAMEAAPEALPIEILKEREADGYKVYQYLIAGNEILEGPKEWAGSYIPIVPVIGKELNVQGKKVLRGLIRWAKDPQRMYNYWRTIATELVTLSPKAPYLVTPEQIEGHEAMWRDANIKSFPYLLYNQTSGPAPQRNFPQSAPQGVFAEAQVAVEDMKAATGIHDARLGIQGNETSGRAITARQRQGEASTFAFVDNLARAIAHAGRILVDLIPKIYDTDRTVLVCLNDGTEAFVPVNKAVCDSAGNPAVVNDLGAGSYAVTVDTGPSYATQRMEAADSMIEFARGVPEAAPLIADLIARNMDWPGAEEIAERLKKTLPPAISGAPPAPPGPELFIKMKKLELEFEKLKLQTVKTENDTRAGIRKTVVDVLKEFKH